MRTCARASKEIIQSHFGISFNSYICLSYGVSTHSFKKNSGLYVLTGELVRNIDATTGYFRFSVEKPEERIGIQTMRIENYDHMKKLGYHRDIYMKSGDYLAIGGYYEDNIFISTYYYNITANVEGTLSLDMPISISMSDIIGDAKHPKQIVFRDNPITQAIMEEIHEKYMNTNFRTPVNTHHEQTSRYISSETKREVWRRDDGKCVRCGSRKNLEYDHIIPVSKGGSNTARNIELLCEECNRSKSNNIE